jgi:uncharacterized protein YyaL (SSP411 family)
LTSHKNKTPNRLINEKSPYLLQHAYNPVDWYPWGPEAFEKAAEEDKPIFLSIGYSTCHWCHVMEKESFEDAEVAEAMNKVFVSIKVDREERPDIDAIYMKVCQMMTGSGGWPLTILMTPGKMPFLAGTYIPKHSSYSRIGMLDLITQIQKMWESERDKAHDISKRVVSSLKQKHKSKSHLLEEETLRFGYLQLSQSFDTRHGGFGRAPKFPIPHNLYFLLRYWKRSGEEKALKMVEKTLKALRNGGIYDHLGFGIHRYSTDTDWLVPHFEKMLYDQALSSIVYTEAYQATGEVMHRRVSEEILEYVLSEMTSLEGGFYSAEDADSEGEEGKFYLWTEEELKNTISQDEFDVFSAAYNISKEGNYFEEATREQTGKNILHMKKNFPEIAHELSISEKSLERKLEEARSKLFTVRGKRLRPNKDDKILTSWNGLMIASLAKAGQAFHNHRYIEAAEKAVNFIVDKIMTPDRRLLRRYRDGEASIPAFIDDYAFFIWGMLELYEATFNPRYLKLAIELVRIMIEHFWDKEEGGFYFTADDAEQVVIRDKYAYDGAQPSGNSVALLVLGRLSKMTGIKGFEERASVMVDHFSDQVYDSPISYTFFLSALDFILGPSNEIVIVGPVKAEDTETMLNAIRGRFLPNKVLLFIPDEASSEITNIVEYTKTYSSLGGKATAYICEDFTCKKPTTDIDEMLGLLQ